MLSGLASHADPRVLVGVAEGDDAGIVLLERTERGTRRALVHTIDVITPIVDDPRTFGRIAAANAVSDIYAMGGAPSSAVALLAVPKELPKAAVAPMLRGADEVLRAAGALLVGGHTIKDRELKLGFAVTGFVDPRHMTTVAGAVPGDRLILTKALGTGVLWSAMKAGARTAGETRAVVASMTRTNAAAAREMIAARVRCATDVTGFGLAGHALNIARHSGADLVLRASALPALPGVWAHLEAGRLPGTIEVNLAGYGRELVVERGVPDSAKRLVADPQTSGGLLLAVAPKKAAALARATGGVEIGTVEVPGRRKPRVLLVR